MTTDTARIQTQFEEWCISTKRAFRDKNGFWMLGENNQQSMFSAYAQGRSDLIEAMHVVGYRYYVDKMDYWEFVDNPVAHRICYPVYALPEDATK